MRKYNRVKKKRCNQADKLSHYLIDAISGNNDTSTKSEADQLKDLMKTLGLDDQTIDFEAAVKNPEQAQALKEQIVLLIMQKDTDDVAMNQVDGMIKEIDKGKEF